MTLMITDKEIKGTFIQSPCMLNGDKHIRYVYEELQVIRLKIKYASRSVPWHFGSTSISLVKRNTDKEGHKVYVLLIILHKKTKSVSYELN